MRAHAGSVTTVIVRNCHAGAGGANQRDVSVDGPSQETQHQSMMRMNQIIARVAQQLCVHMHGAAQTAQISQMMALLKPLVDQPIVAASNTFDTSVMTTTATIYRSPGGYTLAPTLIYIYINLSNLY